jgi:integrase
MKTAQQLWLKALIPAAQGRGLRRGKILNLTWADIDFAGEKINVSPKSETEYTWE